MNNYEFITHWVVEQKLEDNARVLDFGCGAGQIVGELRKNGISAYGCDVFYEGGDYSGLVDNALFADGIIKKMKAEGGNDYAIPFDSASFDLVINNQVMEHVEHLDSVLIEIHRVLKPGGIVLSMFPDKGVWREGHCGIPFLHWFPKKSTLRVYYAAALRSLGLGYHKGDKGIMKWSRDFCDWLDNYTYYRDKKQIQNAYGEYFASTDYIEDYWLQLRLGGLAAWRLGGLAKMLPPIIQKLVVNKLGGMVFISYNKIT